MFATKSLKLGILALLLVTLIIFSGCGGWNPVTPPIDDELDFDEVDRFDSITDSDGLSTFNLEENAKVEVKVKDEKTGTPLSDIKVDMFLYEDKIVYLVADPSGDYLPKIIEEEQRYKNYLPQSKFTFIDTIVKLKKRTDWAIEGYTSGGAQFSDQIDNKFLKYLFDYIFQYGGRTTLGDIKYSMEDAIIAGADVVLSLGITAVFTLSGPIGWALIAIDIFDMGDTFAVAQWAKKYESLGYSDRDYFEVYYWIPVTPYTPSIKIPFYPFIVPEGEPEEISVESINGDITNVSPLTDYFTLNTWYTTYVYVKNTGSVSHTFTVRGVEYIGSSALDFDEEEKSISLEAGNSGYLSFEYTCSGDTDDRVLLFRLYENADDEPLEYIDQMTKAIKYDSGNVDAPTGVTASNGTYTDKVKITWDTVTGASHYHIYRADSSGGAKTALGSWQSNRYYYDYDVTPGDYYYYFVKAATSSSGDNESPYSDYDEGYAYTPNHPPVITSTAVTSATKGQPYSYDVNATDSDGDTLNYSLTTKPTGMSINSSAGLITWTPTATGSFGVTVKVSDGELSATQSFTITVSDSQPDSGNKVFLQSGGILNGTSINPSNPTLTVNTEGSITGTLNVQATYSGTSGNVVPFGYTPSWGSHSSSYVTVKSDLPVGTSTYNASIDLNAPTTSGTYYLIFASNCEMNLGWTMSRTNWTTGSMSWNDGKDIADLTESNLDDSLSTGYLSLDMLVGSSYQTSTYGIAYVKIIVTEGSPVEENGTYALRDIGPAGGYIFYDKGSSSGGWRYLEAAPISTEWYHKQWGSDGTLIGGTGTSIGAGQSNTTKIVTWLNSHSETDRAAQLCDTLVYGGYSDWFLPSIDELTLIYENLYLEGVGDFSIGPAFYWSSSEKNALHALEQYFELGWQASLQKWSSLTVRAVRAF